ncbi:MAG: glycosyltransferase family 2 protein [Candidatus Diapherotrites archaeon]|nr:glycosyltransferase family 2 protein [Candidatus Diapherotrites archaeon]MDZ4256724.1 glycosyltransferase family 2 protein [archaeon]
MPNTHDIAILIPARNEARNLPATIEAVSQSDPVKGYGMDITVCANACTDATPKVLERLKTRHQNLTTIHEWVPGKPHALNALLAHTEDTKSMGSEDVVVFLDADAQVQKETISQLANSLQRNRRLKGVSANDIPQAPLSESVMAHLLFGMSEVSISSIAMQDRKSSCTAVRASAVRGVRFPENIIADEVWLGMYLGFDSVDTHPQAIVKVKAPAHFLEFATRRVKHVMGLYQLEEHFSSEELRANIPLGIHEHLKALVIEPEIREQFSQLDAVYKVANILSFPVHAAIKTIAWVGYRIMPKTRSSTRTLMKNEDVSPASTLSPSA